MHIGNLKLKNFRCFENKEFDFPAQITLISGCNGSGKSSIIEALHYSCYLKSFRTKYAKSLIGLEAQNFIIKLAFQAQESHDLHIAWGTAQRLIKLDGLVVDSYKHLTSLYKIVTLSADDLMLIQGDPDSRRNFIDQSLLLYKPSLITQYKIAKRILEQRNALLKKSSITCSDEHRVWTQKLWDITICLQSNRINFIALLQEKITVLTTQLMHNDALIILRYQSKAHLELEQSFDAFYAQNNTLWNNEAFLKRSNFGIHLDDILIFFKDKKSRNFASRGQQKLVAIILKIAFMQILLDDCTKAVFLLDDFFTDLDEITSHKFLTFIKNLGCQLIITTTHSNYLQQNFMIQDYYHLKL